ncbi:MAG: 30S ribosomal protein S6 [Minisyncoccia bacterium]|jgi:ribosomal protein S6
MDEPNRDDQACVYEIGYLLAGVPEERVPAEADSLRGAITAAGASVLAEEAPHHERLAYTIRKKTVAGSYEKYDAAYFGWIKFEAGSDKVEGLKKTIEAIPAVLRMLLISTVRENTYLGKRASAIAASFVRRPFSTGLGDAHAAPAARKETVPTAPATPASIEEMDKSIEEMVKEV